MGLALPVTTQIWGWGALGDTLGLPLDLRQLPGKDSGIGGDAEGQTRLLRPHSL